MIASFLGGAVIGVLLGLIYCYWKTIMAVYQQRDLIASGGNLVTSAQDFYAQLKKV